MIIVNLQKAHRYIGICVAPFIVMQTISGLLLKFGPFSGGEAAKTDWSSGPVLADQSLARIHFGPGLVNNTCHLLLGAGIIWMALSGWILYLRGRRLRKAVERSGSGGAS